MRQTNTLLAAIGLKFAKTILFVRKYNTSSQLLWSCVRNFVRSRHSENKI